MESWRNLDVRYLGEKAKSLFGRGKKDKKQSAFTEPGTVGPVVDAQFSAKAADADAHQAGGEKETLEKVQQFADFSENFFNKSKQFYTILYELGQKAEQAEVSGSANEMADAYKSLKDQQASFERGFLGYYQRKDAIIGIYPEIQNEQWFEDRDKNLADIYDSLKKEFFDLVQLAENGLRTKFNTEPDKVSDLEQGRRQETKDRFAQAKEEYEKAQKDFKALKKPKPQKIDKATNIISVSAEQQKYNEAEERAIISKEAYENLRGEYAFLSADNFLELQQEAIGKQFEEREEKLATRGKIRRNVEKAGETFYKGYTALGKYSLEAAINKFDKAAGTKIGKSKLVDNKVSRFALRALNVRTAITWGMVGVSMTAGTAWVGLAAVGGRRLMSGFGTSLGVYQGMDSLENWRNSKESQKLLDKLGETATADLNGLTNEGLMERLEMIEEKMALLAAKEVVDGKKLEDLKNNSLYGELKKHYLEGGKVLLDRIKSSTGGQGLNNWLDRSEDTVREIAKLQKFMKGTKKVAAVAVGALMIHISNVLAERHAHAAGTHDHGGTEGAGTKIAPSNGQGKEGIANWIHKKFAHRENQGGGTQHPAESPKPSPTPTPTPEATPSPTPTPTPDHPLGPPLPKNLHETASPTPSPTPEATPGPHHMPGTRGSIAAGAAEHKPAISGANAGEALSLDADNSGIEGALLKMKDTDLDRYKKMISWLKENYGSKAAGGNSDGKLVHRFVLKYASQHNVSVGGGEQDLNRIFEGHITVGADGQIEIGDVKFIKGAVEQAAKAGTSDIGIDNANADVNGTISENLTAGAQNALEKAKGVLLNSDLGEHPAAREFVTSQEASQKAKELFASNTPYEIAPSDLAHSPSGATAAAEHIAPGAPGRVTLQEALTKAQEHKAEGTSGGTSAGGGGGSGGHVETTVEGAKGLKDQAKQSLTEEQNTTNALDQEMSEHLKYAQKLQQKIQEDDIKLNALETDYHNMLSPAELLEHARHMSGNFEAMEHILGHDRVGDLLNEININIETLDSISPKTTLQEFITGVGGNTANKYFNLVDFFKNLGDLPGSPLNDPEFLKNTSVREFLLQFAIKMKEQGK